MGSINLSGNLLQTALSAALQSVGLTNNGNPANSSATSATGQLGNSSDNSQLSPFAQLMNTLQQLQQTDPSKYAQVTQQISTNLQSAAQSATASGNTAAANQLNRLATDFSAASTSGQLPNVADLAKALSGGHHHHHGGGSSDSSSSTSNSNSSPSPSSTATSGAGSTLNSSASQALSQLFSAFQTNSSQSASTDPMTIITGTLSNAGITTG